MCKAVDELAERRAERRAEERRLDTIVNNLKSIMKTTKWTLEQSMDVLELSEEDREILIKRL